MTGAEAVISQQHPGHNAPRLASFGQEEAPAELIAVIVTFDSLAADARSALWPVLRQSLRSGSSPILAPQFRAWRSAHAIDEDAANQIVQSLCNLVHQASATGLKIAEFICDLRILGTELAPLAEIYAESSAALRRQLVQKSQEDHGNVLETVHWQVSTVRASDRALALDSLLISLSLCYRRNGISERLNLLLSPESFLSLRTGLARLDVRKQADDY